MSKAKESIVPVFNHVMGSLYVGVLTEDLDKRSFTEIVKKKIGINNTKKKDNTLSFFNLRVHVLQLINVVNNGPAIRKLSLVIANGL